MWSCPLAGMMQVDMSKRTAVFYTIHVQGQLDASWAPELYGLAISAGPDGTTRLAGALADQAALLGCLNRLINLGAIVLSVESETGQLIKGKGNMLQELTLIQEVEETKIRAQLEIMRDGWNSGSGARYAEPFIVDADYTVWNGMYANGQATIAAQHQYIFDTFYANTTLHYGETHIRFLRDDVALVRFEVSYLTRENGERIQEVGTRPLMVFVKNDGQWQIAAFQNTAIVKQSE